MVTEVFKHIQKTKQKWMIFFLLQWASHLAVESQNVHEDELKRREMFHKEVGKAFSTNTHQIVWILVSQIQWLTARNF